MVYGGVVCYMLFILAVDYNRCVSVLITISECDNIQPSVVHPTSLHITSRHILSVQWQKISLFNDTKTVK